MTDVVIGAVLTMAIIWLKNVGVTIGLIAYGFKQGMAGKGEK